MVLIAHQESGLDILSVPTQHFAAPPSPENPEFVILFTLSHPRGASFGGLLFLSRLYGSTFFTVILFFFFFPYAAESPVPCSIVPSTFISPLCWPPSLQCGFWFYLVPAYLLIPLRPDWDSRHTYLKLGLGFPHTFLFRTFFFFAPLPLRNAGPHPGESPDVFPAVSLFLAAGFSFAKTLRSSNLLGIIPHTVATAVLTSY